MCDTVVHLKYFKMPAASLPEILISEIRSKYIRESKFFKKFAKEDRMSISGPVLRHIFFFAHP